TGSRTRRRTSPPPGCHGRTEGTACCTSLTAAACRLPSLICECCHLSRCRRFNPFLGLYALSPYLQHHRADRDNASSSGPQGCSLRAADPTVFLTENRLAHVRVPCIPTCMSTSHSPKAFW